MPTSAGSQTVPPFDMLLRAARVGTGPFPMLTLDARRLSWTLQALLYVAVSVLDVDPNPGAPP